MKKLLNLTLLTVIAISFLNSTKISLNCHTQKRETTPPSQPVQSLQEILTTINIGQIESNSQEHIIQGLQQAQNLNPATNAIRWFLLTQNTNNNLEFESINTNSARVHLISTQWYNNVFISRIITFTINFITNRFRLSSIITNPNLGYIEDNSSYTILRTLQNTYPLIIQLNIPLSATQITSNSARIRYESENNFPNTMNNYIDITFQTNHPSLNTMNLVTDLGILPDNSLTTILTAFLNLNTHSNLSSQEQLPTVHLITQNSAIIAARIHQEYWTINNDYYMRPIIIQEEEQTDLYYALVPDTIRVTFTLQNNNQNETQILRPNNNNNLNNNVFNDCSSSLDLSNLDSQNFEQKNEEDSKHYCVPIKDILGNVIKPDDIYFGTNGVYLKSDSKIYKTNNSNRSILDIRLNNENNVYIVTNKKEIYHLNLNNWDLTKIPNVESSNLAKEIKLFYNEKKESLEIENNWWNKPSNYTIIHDFNLGKINPLDYQKIEFLGDDKDFNSKISWGNTDYYGKKLSEFNSKNLKDYLTKCHIIIVDNGVIDEKCNEGRTNKINIQNINENYLLADIYGYQKCILTLYKNNDNYHIQVIVEQEVRTTGSLSGGAVWLNIGKGIRLYND